MIELPKGQLLDAQFLLGEKLKLGLGMKVAHLGCGDSGYYDMPAARMIGKDGILYVLDIQKAALEGVKSRAKLEGIYNIEYVWSNLEIYGAAKAITDQSLDAAFLINVLFQSKKRKEILNESKRMLKSGGRLLVVDWKREKTPFGPDLSLRVDKEEIKNYAQELGFEIEEEFEAGSFHWGIILKKK